MGVENLLKVSGNVGMFHAQGFFQIAVRGRGVIPLSRGGGGWGMRNFAMGIFFQVLGILGRVILII